MRAKKPCSCYIEAQKGLKHVSGSPVNIGKTDQLDELAHECGKLYSQTVVSFWRTVKHKGIWLKPKHLMRWHTSKKLHAHTADACVQLSLPASKAGVSVESRVILMFTLLRSASGTFGSSTNARRWSSKMGSFGFPMARATNHWYSPGPGNCRTQWLFTGGAPSTKAIATYEQEQS